MFYRLDVPAALGVTSLALARPFQFVSAGFGAGEPVDAAALVTPWRATVRSSPGVTHQLNDHYPALHLMSERMVAALRSAGADNLQTVPCHIEGAPADALALLAVNVVGCVPCLRPFAEDLTGLRIDAARAAGWVIFRPAESRSALLVNEAAAAALRAAHLRNLTLEPVAIADGGRATGEAP